MWTRVDFQDIWAIVLGKYSQLNPFPAPSACHLYLTRSIKCQRKQLETLEGNSAKEVVTVTARTFRGHYCSPGTQLQGPAQRMQCNSNCLEGHSKTHIGYGQEFGIVTEQFLRRRLFSAWNVASQERQVANSKCNNHGRYDSALVAVNVQFRNNLPNENF